MTSPASSTISITYDGTDITQYVLFNSARFECQVNAVPGQATFTVKDEDRTLSFEVGKEIYLYVDDIKMFGGLVMRIGRQLALPVDDTSTISSVKTRQWVLECLDFNVWFDKRYIRDTNGYTSNKGLLFSLPKWDGEIIRDILPNFIDVPPGVDMSTYVENIHQIVTTDQSVSGGKGSLVQQGTKWRDEMSQLAAFSAANYYIDADKNLHFESLQSSTMPWAFVDYQPNDHTRVPVRDVSATQDGTLMVNDALVWGGLDVEGSIYFSRYQDSASEAEYGRWQLGELHFNEGMDQSVVTQRAAILVEGTDPTGGNNPVPGQDPNGVATGLKFPLWRVRLSWFGHHIPRVAGVPQHIRPGQLVSIILYVMGEDVAHPLNLFLPLLNMTVTFPQLAGGGESWVRFDGEFGLTYSDSRYLWKYILKQQGQKTYAIAAGGVSNSSTSSGFGDFATLTPILPPDGTRKVFTFPFPMLPRTVEVFVNGLKWREHQEYEITGAQEITLYSALASDDQLYVEARTGTG